MKKLLLTLLLIPILNLAQALWVIPDQNFENKLIELGYDNVLDGWVFENSSVYDLDLSYALIEDLTGIEAFPQLETLNAPYNLLTSLNLTSLNQLIYLNVDMNPSLSFLDLGSLQWVDNISISVTSLSCVQTDLAYYYNQQNSPWAGFFAIECGCTNPEASNYELSATGNDGSCIIYGCQDETACNYNAEATNEINGICEYPEEFYNCNGVCLNDIDEDGICDELEVLGCTEAEADNYNPLATDNDESCYYTIYGCTDSLACNYDELANEDFNSSLCQYPEEFYNCNGVCLNDMDEDGICDELEILGCTEEEADNYNPLATWNDGSCYYIIYGCTDESACNYDELANEDFNSSLCQYPEEFYNCNGVCFNDTDEDGICDELEVLGCTEAEADNYNPLATDNDESCYYTIYGCTDSLACNYDELANEDFNLSLCEYAEEFYDCDGFCLSDIDGDGICDENEEQGCMDESACNYNIEATEDDGSCYYPGDECIVWGADGEFMIGIYNWVCECVQDTSSISEEKTKRNLIKITDILGREIKNLKGIPVFYIYDDGSVEKIINLK